MEENKSVFGGMNLPDPAALAASFGSYEAEVQNLGSVYMKFTEGEYLFGSDSTVTQEGSLWLVNPWSALHGWILFGNRNDVLDEVLVPATQALPERKPNPSTDISKSGYQEQWAITMMCTNGDDNGLEVVFKTSSGGGTTACKKLMAAFAQHVKNGGAAIPLPLIELLSGSYKSKQWNKTIKHPVFEIRNWLGAEHLKGSAAPAAKQIEAAPEVEAECDVEYITEQAPVDPPTAQQAAPAPTRRRPVADAVPEPAPVQQQAAPAPAAEAPRRRRAV